MEQDTTQHNLADPPSTSGDMMTRGQLHFVELLLVPFTPSKKHVVACMYKVVFDPKQKTIVLRFERMLQVGTQPEHGDFT